MKERIMKLLCEDFSQKEIAEQFKISRSYIEKCVRNLKDEYDVKTLNGLISCYLKSQNDRDKIKEM